MAVHTVHKVHVPAVSLSCYYICFLIHCSSVIVGLGVFRKRLVTITSGTEESSKKNPYNVTDILTDI